MKEVELIKVIEDNYKLKVDSLEKVKNTYKVKTNEKEYCIKIIKYEYEHFKFILSAINHLQKNKFQTIPPILKSNIGIEYIKLDKSYAYLTEWIPSRLSNYDNPIELTSVSSKLGELHKCSCGFNLEKGMHPRIGWYSWIKVFETRCNEIIDFKNRINQKAYKSQFDKIYFNYVEQEVKRGLEAVEQLKENNYFTMMDKEVMRKGFCHHDYAHHNILVDSNNKLNIIDFDYCILDSHLHDLSSLLIRVMKDGKWSKDTAELILNSYSSTNNVNEKELKLIKAFIKFPQNFWQIGLQYYWEQQPWEEEFFINKINKYIEDISYREEFIEQYF